MKNRIRLLRERLGWTQEELAERTGVSRQALGAIEKGKYEPSIWLAYDIARAFELPIEEVFLFEESIKKTRAESSKGGYYGLKNNTAGKGRNITKKMQESRCD